MATTATTFQMDDRSGQAQAALYGKFLAAWRLAYPALPTQDAYNEARQFWKETYKSKGHSRHEYSINRVAEKMKELEELSRSGRPPRNKQPTLVSMWGKMKTKKENTQNGKGIFDMEEPPPKRRYRERQILDVITLSSGDEDEEAPPPPKSRVVKTDNPAPLLVPVVVLERVDVHSTAGKKVEEEEVEGNENRWVAAEAEAIHGMVQFLDADYDLKGKLTDDPPVKVGTSEQSEDHREPCPEPEEKRERDPESVGEEDEEEEDESKYPDIRFRSLESMMERG